MTLEAFNDFSKNQEVEIPQRKYIGVDEYHNIVRRLKSQGMSSLTAYLELYKKRIYPIVNDPKSIEHRQILDLRDMSKFLWNASIYDLIPREGYTPSKTIRYKGTTTFDDPLLLTVYNLVMTAVSIETNKKYSRDDVSSLFHDRHCYEYLKRRVGHSFPETTENLKEHAYHARRLGIQIDIQGERSGITPVSRTTKRVSEWLGESINISDDPNQRFNERLKGQLGQSVLQILNETPALPDRFIIRELELRGYTNLPRAEGGISICFSLKD